MGWPPGCRPPCSSTRTAALCSSFAAGARSRRHSASFRSETGEPEGLILSKTFVELGRRPTISRTPGLTASVSSAAMGICQGADCISCVAGRTPSPISLWTEPTQMPSRAAAASALIVSVRGSVGSKAPDPEPLAKLAHPNGGPDVAVGEFAPHPVHRHGQFAIRQLAAEFADRLDWARVAITRITAGSHP